MAITKESLQKQLEKLQANREQLLAQMNATAGAIQQVLWLISEVDAEEAEKKPV